MGFILNGNIRELVQEAHTSAENLDELNLNVAVNKVRNYLSTKSNPLYKRFLRLKIEDAIHKYDSILASYDDVSYLSDIAGK